MQKISRREALRWIGSGAVALALPSLWSCAHRALAPAPKPSDKFKFSDISPVDRNYTVPVGSYSGDNPDRAHKILWDKPAYLKQSGGFPEVTEEATVVVVGGGMGGLISAYLLRDLKPVLLERAERFGGNARGESWNGIDYSIGAAYFTSAEEGTPLHALFSDAGIYKLTKVKSDADPILYKGKLYSDFLNGSTDPEHRRQFLKFKKLFKDFGFSRNGRVYPMIPYGTAAEKKSVLALDRYNFLEFMEKEMGGPLHPHLRSLLEDYCWSSMGSGMKETSAALGICFFAGEFQDVLVTPGGNSRVAEQFLSHLHNAMPANLRPSSVVLDVEVQDDFSFVTYENAAGKLRRIKARAVVMACPKFVAKKIIQKLEPARIEAIESMRYQPYLVANALLKVPLKKPYYDTFLIGDGSMPSEDIRVASLARGATDVVNANFAGRENPNSVLTLYRALPFAGGRAEIFAPEGYARFEKEFRAQLETEILPSLGYEQKDLMGLRIARWGHSMPTASPGIYSNGTLETIQAPFERRVFFVQQDNWACPAVETCAKEALRWMPKVRELLTESRTLVDPTV
jgi:hypothetical protein